MRSETTSFMQMHHDSRTPSPQPTLCERRSFRHIRLASRSSSPHALGHEQKLKKSASTSNGDDQTPRQRDTRPTTRFNSSEDLQSPACLIHSDVLPGAGFTCSGTKFAYPEEEHASNAFSGNDYAVPFSKEQAMTGPPSQQQILQAHPKSEMTPTFASQMPDMLAAQLPLVASPGQVFCLPSLAGKGRRWADMDDEELEIASGDALAEVPPEDAFSVSKGSTGHPFSCNAPCKYALKPRGCKDGAECDRCHLCKWKKPMTPILAANSDAKKNKCKSNARGRFCRVKGGSLASCP